ncbi:hypothetical protein L1887_21878 [Cichorium endivia]|nr:hypothetical protein L1887_21878 [Cichorium endivia]
MASNIPNAVDCETNKKKYKPKIVWDNETLMTFITLCLNELKKGNRPGTHFNKVGWENLEKYMKEETGKAFDRKQLKNKWDNMKKDWKLYDRLMRLETGIGGSRSVLDASPEWWEEKIKVDKEFAKFRDTNLDIYQTHYAPLFSDAVAVGDRTMTPGQFQNDSNLDDVENEEHIEGKGDSDELNGDEEPLFASFPESSSSKRKQSTNTSKRRSTKSKTSTFEEKLDVVLDALSSRSTPTFPPTNPTPTISEVMNIVSTFPGFEEGSEPYSTLLHAFMKKQSHEAFMVPTTPEGKMGFLKVLLRKSNDP